MITAMGFIIFLLQPNERQLSKLRCRHKLEYLKERSLRTNRRRAAPARVWMI